MAYIKTSTGKIKYRIHPLYLGIKRINKYIAKENVDALILGCTE